MRRRGVADADAGKVLIEFVLDVRQEVIRIEVEREVAKFRVPMAILDLNVEFRGDRVLSIDS